MADTKPMPVSDDTTKLRAELGKAIKDRDDARAKIAEIEKADAKLVDDNAKLAKANADAGVTIAGLQKSLDAQTEDLRKLARDNLDLRKKLEVKPPTSGKAGQFRPWLRPPGEPGK